MIKNLFLQQLARRVDGDRKAMAKTLEILRSMIDRKLWKQMESSTDLPTDFEQIELLFEKHNVFFRHITLSDGWWSRCTGKMLGFMAEDDTPVALVPGFTDYTFVTPKTGESMKASKRWSPAEEYGCDCLFSFFGWRTDCQGNCTLCRALSLHL